MEQYIETIRDFNSCSYYDKLVMLQDKKEVKIIDFESGWVTVGLVGDEYGEFTDALDWDPESLTGDSELRDLLTLAYLL